jgi:SAM-dependent methyltransferase
MTGYPLATTAVRKMRNLAFRSRLGYEIRWLRGYFSIHQAKTIEKPAAGRRWSDPSNTERTNAERAIVAKLKEYAIDVVDYRVDVGDYRGWVERARYEQFPKYYGGGAGDNFAEKSLEHYLAAKFLSLKREDVYVDIASADSPTADIYRRMYGCEVYRQDIEYPVGMHENVIGGDAGDLPLNNGSVSKMALHCSFEHFELDSDMRFIREAGRVLRKGGRLCIVPLYLSKRYTVVTDPGVWPWKGVPFESDATVRCVKGYRTRHGRLYDVPHLNSRVCNNLNRLSLTVYVVQNEKEVDPSCYVKFAAVFNQEKEPSAQGLT